MSRPWPPPGPSSCSRSRDEHRHSGSTCAAGVFTPRDAEAVADYLARGRQRRRWGRFLAAKEALLSMLGKAQQVAADLVEQYRLGGAVRAVKATVGWLAGGYRLLRRGLEIVGMASAVGMVIASPTIRTLTTRVGQAAVSVVNNVTTMVTGAGRAFLGWFGSPGRALAARLSRTVSTVNEKVSRVVQPVYVALQTALDVTALPVRTMGVLAHERAVGRLLGGLLPQPWATIARVVVGVLLLPDSVRREGIRLLLDGLARLLNPRPTASKGPRAGRAPVGSVRVPLPAPRVTPARLPEPGDLADRQPQHQDEQPFDEAAFDAVLEAELDVTEGPLPPRRLRQSGRPNKRSSGPRR